MSGINSPLLFALLSAAVTTVVIVAAVMRQWQRTRRELKRFKSKGLRPNILLTRHPLVFLSRPPGLFRIYGDFAEIPFLLREHGFDVKVVELNPKFQSHPALAKPSHVFFRTPSNPPISKQGIPNAVSLNFIETLCFDSLLRTSVDLAESDLQK